MRKQTTQLKLKKKLSRHLLKECVKIANRYIIVLDLTFVKKYRNKHDELSPRDFQDGHYEKSKSVEIANGESEKQNRTISNAQEVEKQKNRVMWASPLYVVNTNG